MATTNVIDLPWILVTRNGREELVGLRTALAEAHLIEALGVSLQPVEREALLRLLESAAAAVLLGQDPEDVEDARCINSALVDAFFVRYADRFDLAHPDKPFLQEWHTHDSPTAFRADHWREVKYLHLRQPGRSSSLWGVMSEPRDACDPAVLAVLLTASWFHGKPGNERAATFYRPTGAAKHTPIAGSPAGGMLDTSCHLIGANLAETLLFNIPMSWLDSADPPAWLDQDAEPPPARYIQPGTLWRCTWTANRAVVEWDAGTPVRFSRGVTKRFIPPLATNFKEGATPFDRLKAHSKAVGAGDYAHILSKKKRTVSRLTAPLNFQTAQGYEEWYRDDFNSAGATQEWINTPRVLPVEDHTKLGFYNERCDKNGNRATSVWTEIPLYLVNITGEPAAALQAVISHVSALRYQAQLALKFILGKDESVVKRLASDKDKSGLIADIAGPIYAALDEPILNAVSAAGHGEVLDTTAVRVEMTQRARTAFFRATEALLTPATAEAVYKARHQYLQRTHVNTDNEEATTHE